MSSVHAFLGGLCTAGKLCCDLSYVCFVLVESPGDACAIEQYVVRSCAVLLVTGLYCQHRPAVCVTVSFASAGMRRVLPGCTR